MQPYSPRRMSGHPGNTHLQSAQRHPRSTHAWQMTGSPRFRRVPCIHAPQDPLQATAAWNRGCSPACPGLEPRRWSPPREN